MAKPRGFSSGFGGGFGVGRYYYSLAPYEWHTSPFPHWRQPASVVGGVDLRTLSAMGTAGGTPQGFAFVASMQPTAGVAIARSLNFIDEDATSLMQDAWEGEMDYRPQGTKLVDLLWDQITTGADPTGADGPKPLMPGVDGTLKLFLPGHSLVKSEAFRWGIHPHTNRVQAVLQRDFEREWEATNGSDHCRRALDYTCKKYRIDDWHQFVPARLRPHVQGRLPHATTISDTFNRANQTHLGTSSGGWSWARTGDGGTGTVDISSNQTAVTMGTSVSIRYRAESDLSGDDHYAQVTVVDLGSTDGALDIAYTHTRFNSGADTCYYAQYRNDTPNIAIGKIEAGTFTELDADVITRGYPQALKCEIDGSSLKGYQAGVERSSVTDTAITGNTRTGVGSLMLGDRVWLDDYEAADLAAAFDAATLPRFSAQQPIRPRLQVVAY